MQVDSGRHALGSRACLDRGQWQVKSGVAVVHIAGPEQAAALGRREGPAPGRRQRHAYTFSPQQMVIEVCSKGGTMRIMDHTKGADIVGRPGEQKGAAEAERLPVIHHVGLPARCCACLAGIGEHQKRWMREPAELRSGEHRIVQDPAAVSRLRGVEIGMPSVVHEIVLIQRVQQIDFAELFPAHDGHVEVVAGSEQTAQLLALLPHSRQRLCGVCNDEHFEWISVLWQCDIVRPGMLMADHLAANAEFGAQKIAAVEGQFPRHVDELIVHTEKEVSGGKSGKALLHRHWQEMRKNQCSQALHITVSAWAGSNRAATPDALSVARLLANAVILANSSPISVSRLSSIWSQPRGTTGATSVRSTAMVCSCRSTVR